MNMSLVNCEVSADLKFDALPIVVFDEDAEQEIRQFLRDISAICSERLTQMTKTYDDIDAVTSLLYEKEKDLQLAARIGQSLLEQNKELRIRNEFLEEQLSYASEEVTQLKHDIQTKTDLLHIFTEDTTDSAGSTPSSDTWGTLHRKVQKLEDENLALKAEQSQLKNQTEGLESMEKDLIDGCVKQLVEKNETVELLSIELAERNDECQRQQEELTALLSKQVDLQKNCTHLTLENEELVAQVRSAKEAQFELTQELIDLQDRYAEVLAMLQEAKDEIRELTNRKAPLEISIGESLGYESQQESLLSELEATSDSGYGISPITTNRTPRSDKISDQLSRIMGTVRCIKYTEDIRECQTAQSSSFATASPAASPSCIPTARLFTPKPPAPVLLAVPGASNSPTASSAENSATSQSGSNESLSCIADAELGVPGIPGSKDLKAAIYRLKVRRQVEQSYAEYREKYSSRPNSRRDSGCAATSTTTTTSTSLIPTAVTVTSATPEPSLCASSELNNASQSSFPKVEIVKAIRGSALLRQWSSLASTDLLDVFRNIPGVLIKADAPLLPASANEASASASASSASLRQLNVPSRSDQIRRTSLSEQEPVLPSATGAPSGYCSSGNLNQSERAPSLCSNSVITTNVLHPSCSNSDEQSQSRVIDEEPDLNDGCCASRPTSSKSPLLSRKSPTPTIASRSCLQKIGGLAAPSDMESTGGLSALNLTGRFDSPVSLGVLRRSDLSHVKIMGNNAVGLPSHSVSNTDASSSKSGSNASGSSSSILLDSNKEKTKKRLSALTVENSMFRL